MPLEKAERWGSMWCDPGVLPPLELSGFSQSLLLGVGGLDCCLLIFSSGSRVLCVQLLALHSFLLRILHVQEDTTRGFWFGLLAGAPERKECWRSSCRLSTAFVSTAPPHAGDDCEDAGADATADAGG